LGWSDQTERDKRACDTSGREEKFVQIICRITEGKSSFGRWWDSADRDCKEKSCDIVDGLCQTGKGPEAGLSEDGTEP
jgi:hypothetical protein